MFLRKAEERDLPSILNITEKVVPIMQASGNSQWSIINIPIHTMISHGS